MDIGKIVQGPEEQDKGSWWDILHPVTGTPTGMRVLIAGPDSNIQQQARFALNNIIRTATRDGRILPAERENELMVNFLSALVIDWEAIEDGKPVEFSIEALKRVLNAGSWFRAQVDAYAASRVPFAGPITDEVAA